MDDSHAKGWKPYFGAYAVFGELGRGGMGVVYAARHPKLGRDVALKVLHGGMALTAQAVDRLRVEAEAAARLAHENIVPIYEVGEHEGQAYLAMGLIEGESLAERIARDGPLTPRDAAGLVAKIARAVQHAHDHAVLHRDLKPANILLDQGGEPYLSDFGLAKCLDSDSGLTQTGTFLGTPAYASPEQASGKLRLVTTASDVYCLGAVLYAVLTGHPPFAGETPSEIIELVQSKAPTRPRLVRPTIPADLETICLKCLEKEPGRRYASALGLAEDLDRLLQGRPIVARPVGMVERLWLWARREPLLASLVTAVGLLLVGGLMAFVFGSRELAAQQRRQILIQQLVTTRLISREAGWAGKGWDAAREAARGASERERVELRSQAAAFLGGLEARREVRFTNVGASSVVFDREGRRVLMGGVEGTAKLWSAAGGDIVSLPFQGPASGAFGAGGEPRLLGYDSERQVLRLARADTGETITEWRVPHSVGDWDMGTNRFPLAVVCRDGACAVAGLQDANGKGWIALGQADGLLTLLGGPTEPVTAVAISGDGGLVAAAFKNSVEVWSVKERRLIGKVESGRAEVRCLVLSQRFHRTESKGSEPSWLLAAGDGVGNVKLWDVLSQHILSQFHSSSYAIHALALSGDGTTLACAGHGLVEIRDVATGRLLLNLPEDNVSSLDFSPAGDRLAIGAAGGFGNPSSSIYHLEAGRGMQTLRGLSGTIEKVCFSDDGTRAAALSRDWELGIWDLKAGQLLWVLEVPGGGSPDNAAIRFTPTGDRLAYAGHETARVWDTVSGIALVSRELPCGLGDQLAAPDASHIMLFRAETLDGLGCPYGGGSDRKTNPIVCRIRDLLKPEEETALNAKLGFEQGFLTAGVSGNDQIFIGGGLHSDGQSTHTMVKAFDSVSGRELWSKTWTNWVPGSLKVDLNHRSSRYFRLQSPGTNDALAEAESGKYWKMFPEFAISAVPELELFAATADATRKSGYTILQPENRPLLRVGIDSSYCSMLWFDRDGNLLMWGNTDGSVVVCDLKAIRSRLGEIGLGW